MVDAGSRRTGKFVSTSGLPADEPAEHKLLLAMLADVSGTRGGKPDWFRLRRCLEQQLGESTSDLAKIGVLLTCCGLLAARETRLVIAAAGSIASLFGTDDGEDGQDMFNFLRREVPGIRGVLASPELVAEIDCTGPEHAVGRLATAVAAAHYEDTDLDQRGGICGTFGETAQALLAGGLRPALRWAAQIICTTIPHAIWLIAAVELLRQSLGLRPADAASAAVLRDPRLVVDTFRLAMNAHRGVSALLASLRRVVPDSQVKTLSILGNALNGAMVCGQLLWRRQAPQLSFVLKRKCADMFLDILTSLFQDMACLLRTRDVAPLAAALVALGNVLWLGTGWMMRNATDVASPAAIGKLAAAAAQALQPAHGDLDDSNKTALILIAARYLRKLGEHCDSHMQLQVDFLQHNVLPRLHNWQQDPQLQDAVVLQPFIADPAASGRISKHHDLMVLLADELAVGIAADVRRVLTAKPPAGRSGCPLTGGVELDSVFQALSLGSLEVLWDYLGRASQGRMHRVHMDNNIRLPAEEEHGRQLNGERAVADVLACLTFKHLEAGEKLQSGKLPPRLRSKKEKYVSVVQHLESAPAQDVVALLQHLEQELRLAVRTGNAVVGTGTMAIHATLAAVACNDEVGGALRLQPPQQLFIAAGGCRVLRRTIFAASMAKCKRIADALCLNLAMLIRMNPAAAQWQQVPATGGVDDSSWEKQCRVFWRDDAPLDQWKEMLEHKANGNSSSGGTVAQAALPNTARQQAAQPTALQAGAAAGDVRQQHRQREPRQIPASRPQTASATSSPAAAGHAAAAAAAAEAAAECMAQLLMQEEDAKEQQEAARAAKAASKAKRKQQRRVQGTDTTEDGEQQGSLPAERDTASDVAAASPAAPMAESRPQVAAAAPPAARPSASSTPADTAATTQHAATAWQLCPLSKRRMVDPVLLPEDAQTYERAAITAWLQQHGTSPLTGQPADATTLMPNHTLRSLLQAVA